MLVKQCLESMELFHWKSLLCFILCQLLYFYTFFQDSFHVISNLWANVPIVSWLRQHYELCVGLGRYIIEKLLFPSLSKAGSGTHRSMMET